MISPTSYLNLVRRVVGPYEPLRVEPTGRPSAGVLLLFYDAAGETHLLFTKRTELVEHHKGEICFPGGSQEAGDDDLYHTALRETFEEIGILPEDVERVGRLDDIVSRGSNFVVSPFVGFLKATEPYHYRHADDEVDEILEVPLSHLLDPANSGREMRNLDGHDVEIIFYRFGRHVIWGATARMLNQLLGLLTAGE